MKIRQFIRKTTTVLILGMLLLQPMAAYAAEPFSIVVDGRTIKIENGQQAGELIAGRTYVPLRVVADALDVDVSWLKTSQQVVITTTGNTTDVPTYKPKNYSDIQIVLNGKAMTFSSQTGQPYLSKLGRTMLPLRALGEALNCDVSWNNSARQVLITSKTASNDSNSGLPDDLAGLPPTQITPVPSVTIEPADTENETDNSEKEDTTDPKEQGSYPLFTSLAAYGTNLKMLNGSVINSSELANADPADYGQSEIERLQGFLKELQKYPANITLPDGENIRISDITIFGESIASEKELKNWLNSELNRIESKVKTQYGRELYPLPDDIVELYLEIGDKYGIRGDIALCQAAKETYYFQYTGQVQQWQNNYCGLYATGTALTGIESLNGADPHQVSLLPGMHGAAFASVEAGVEAHIQHLYAYATKKNLPSGETLVDPRFSLVKRAENPDWTHLNARWAVPGTTYAQSIICDYWMKALN